MLPASGFVKVMAELLTNGLSIIRRKSMEVLNLKFQRHDDPVLNAKKVSSRLKVYNWTGLLSATFLMKAYSKQLGFICWIQPPDSYFQSQLFLLQVLDLLDPLVSLCLGKVPDPCHAEESTSNQQLALLTLRSFTRALGSHHPLTVGYVSIDGKSCTLRLFKVVNMILWPASGLGVEKAGHKRILRTDILSGGSLQSSG